MQMLDPILNTDLDYEAQKKAVRAQWMAEKFVDLLAKKSERGDQKAGRVWGTAVSRSDTASQQSALPNKQKPNQENRFQERQREKLCTQRLAHVEEEICEGGEYYFSGSEYGDDSDTESREQKIIRRKNRLNRICSAMEGEECQRSLSLQHQFMESAEARMDVPVWDGGDAYFSGSDSEDDCRGNFEVLSSAVACANLPRSNLDLLPSEHDGRHGLQAVQSLADWGGGDAYFSGSDYGDTA